MKDINNWQTKFEPCQYSDKLLDKLTLLNKTTNNPVDIQEVKKAIYYARKYHGEQKRQSGEAYYSHPLEVAWMVSDYLFETNAIVTSILHDTIEDTELTIEMIASIFGHQVARQVEDLTRIKVSSKISAAEIMTLLLQEPLKSDSIIIKIFDRIHNMETINIKSPEKIRETVEETLKSFLPVCTHFGYIQLEDYLYKLCCNAMNIEVPNKSNESY
jgi:(p)ppGpp synthase/HD superfamily hydrolase